MTYDGRKAVRTRLGLYQLIEQFTVPEYTEDEEATRMIQDRVSEILFGWCKEQLKVAKEQQRLDDLGELGWL